jgi:hypothetical protein
MQQDRLKGVPFFNSMSKKDLAAVAQQTTRSVSRPARCSPAKATSATSSS